ncbi:MAG: glutathione synthase [Cellvibrionaceae bacterium]|nr:glutathione synthase [Cellvibrionaceae bacterium]
MSIKLGVVMDPIAHITPHKDTTLALLLAAAAEGWELFYMELQDLFLQGDTAMGRLRALRVSDSEQQWYSLAESTIKPLGELDVILMRKDPPFDTAFLHGTFILEAAVKQGCRVVNDPKSLRDCNEKLFATQFPQCCPPLMVSNNQQLLRAFYEQHQDVIFKPLDGMGGSQIFRCKPDDANINVILETLTDKQRHYIMAQRFIPAIAQGDKRILVVNGEPVPYALARIPAQGETRGNLAAGGRGETRPLSARDHWIVKQVAPALLAKNLLFVGLDVIGDYLTEINVTSPTCAREIDKAHDTAIGKRLITAIATQLSL